MSAASIDAAIADARRLMAVTPTRIWARRGNVERLALPPKRASGGGWSSGGWQLFETVDATTTWRGAASNEAEAREWVARVLA